MSDIIVTTPKSRMAEAAAEAEQIKNWRGGEYYRFYSSPPPVAFKDRVYYVEDGYVQGFCLVKRVGYDGRRYKMLMDAVSWQWIKPIAMTGFRGWRYAPWKRHRIEIVGGWLDPKPEVPE